MSRNAVMMSGQVKVEHQSPVKLDVLKPSNAANLQNIQNKTSGVPGKAVKEGNVGRTVFSSSRSVIGKVTSRTNSLRSSPPSSKSPHKALTPIRPSPNVKFSHSSSRSPSSPYVRTPTSMTRVSASSGGLASGLSTSSSPGKCRRRISYSDSGDLPVPVSRRNARERNRVKMVSQGFAILRQHVPHAARKKKLSKVETLRCAVEYIRGLQLLLDNHPPVVTHPPAIHPHPHHPHHQGMLPLGSTSSSTPSTTSLSSASYHQQLHPQVFLHPHQNIEPHILKLPTAEDTYQNLGQMRYDGPDGAFLRTSPNSSDISPTSSFYEQKFTPPGSAAEPPGTNTSPTSTISSSSSTSPSSLPLGVIKTEGNEEMRTYGREEQDLLEALAWWQHNIN